METIEIEIQKLDHQGRGIGYHEGKIIFVPNTLPNEIVIAKIIQNKKKYSIGEAVSYLQKSSDRIIPSCSYYELCGGCDLMHMPYHQQLQFKQNKIVNIMEKYCGLGNKVRDIVENSHPIHYRNKITLQVWGKEFGFYEKKSNQIVPIASCFLAHSKINVLIPLFYQLDLSKIEQIMIRSAQYTSDSMIVFYMIDMIDFTPFVDEFKKYVSSMIVIHSGTEKILFGNGFMVEKMNDWQFQISPDSFFQVNTEQAIKLYDLVLEKAHLTGKERVLDLYCGTGTISLYLSPFAHWVDGIEINQRAIDNANENKKMNHVSNVSFICVNANEVLKKIECSYDVVVVDPPRSGLDHKTLESIIKIAPSRIVYVSCDPITLARDINGLSQYYNIMEIIPIDLFSETAHVECVCVFERR